MRSRSSTDGAVRGIAAVLFAAVLFAVALVACAPSARPEPTGASLHVDNASAMSVVITVDGGTPTHIKPDSGALVATFGGAPTVVVLSTEQGTRLGEWRPTGGSGAWDFDPGPSCGHVTIWIGNSPGPSETPAVHDPSECPQ
jgi:hypothetical protein